MVVEDGPKPAAAAARKFASNAPVNLVIHKAADSAGDIWERYKGSDEPLWQLQLGQNSMRPLTGIAYIFGTGWHFSCSSLALSARR